MPFFQNPFKDEFRASVPLGDRHYTPTFVLKENAGRAQDAVWAFVASPFDLSGTDPEGDDSDTLNICYAMYGTKNWATMSIDVTTAAASSAAVTSSEIVNSLNANVAFAERFVAEIGQFENKAWRVVIRQKRPITEFRFYIVNGQAEHFIKFNGRAGVAELPTYYSRHTIANRFSFEDSQGCLIELDPTNDVDAAVIDGAVDYKGVTLGYSSSDVQDDWELLKGSSGLFQFTKGPSVNVVTATETVVVYPAGARAGDLAMKTVTRKDAGGLVVQKFEMPYTLESGDLITPP